MSSYRLLNAVFVAPVQNSVYFIRSVAPLGFNTSQLAAGRFIAKQISKIISSGGHEVVAIASNGLQGFEKYKKLYPYISLVIMDITMPVMDGSTVLEKILDFDGHAKVITIKAPGKEDVVKSCLLMGRKITLISQWCRRKYDGWSQRGQKSCHETW